MNKKERKLVVNKKTIVDEYWSEHTVRAKYFRNQHESKKYSIKRLRARPFHKEFMELDKSRNGEIILDYGCGPGNDLVNFIMNSNAKEIIGIDISDKALKYAKHQTSLYTESDIPIRFIKIMDNTKIIPLEDESMDYIICTGVLQHTTDPTSILKEFFRILKNKSYIHIMVYNRDSIFFHVRTAYQLKGGFIGNDVDEVFKRNTDGINCPISKAYKAHEFIEICDNVGFKTEFVGGYISPADTTKYLNEYKHRILTDPKLNDEHKEFVRLVRINNDDIQHIMRNIGGLVGCTNYIKGKIICKK